MKFKSKLNHVTLVMLVTCLTAGYLFQICMISKPELPCHPKFSFFKEHIHWFKISDGEHVPFLLKMPLNGQNMFLVTWRIIPVSKWLITMVNTSPKDRVVPLPNGLNGL